MFALAWKSGVMKNNSQIMHSPKLKLNEIISYQISKFEIINKIKRMFSGRPENYDPSSFFLM